MQLSPEMIHRILEWKRDRLNIGRREASGEDFNSEDYQYSDDDAVEIIFRLAEILEDDVE